MTIIIINIINVIIVIMVLGLIYTFLLTNTMLVNTIFILIP